jgi:hypothetical protein
MPLDTVPYDRSLAEEMNATRCRRPTILASILAVVGMSLSGGSPGTAAIAGSTTSAATATQSAAPGGGGNRTVMMVGNAAQGTKFSACMRTRGIENFPDPNPQGVIQFGSVINPRSPAFMSALSACRKLLPAGFGQAPTSAQLELVQQQLLGFSVCMRAHRIMDFPDPSGAALPQIHPVGDLDPNNPQFQAAENACKGHLPGNLPAKALGGLALPTTGNIAGG